MPKLGLISLGCAKNLVDSEHMLARLRDAGWEITEDMTEADVGVGPAREHGDDENDG